MVLYIVTANDKYYPASGDGDWCGVFTTYAEAEACAKQQTDEFVYIIQAASNNSWSCEMYRYPKR